MIIFVKLLLAHLLGDFLLQPDSWVKHKEQYKHRSRYLYIHTLLHGLLALCVIDWELALVLAASHGFIDYLKLKLQTNATKRSWFIIDQLLHLTILVVISLWANGPVAWHITPDNQFWIVLTGVLLLITPTSILIKNIISIWTPENKDSDTTSSLQNAGMYIGILERLFVVAFLLTGHFESVGFLLAAKSIFRFGDLMEAKERKLTEYVLIGTLLSFGIALLTGMLIQYAVALQL